jgi:hypothetical protein
MVPLWVVVGGVTVTSSATLAEIIASLLAPEVIIVAAVAVGVYVVVNIVINRAIIIHDPQGREVNLNDETIEKIIKKHPEIGKDKKISRGYHQRCYRKS